MNLEQEILLLESRLKSDPQSFSAADFSRLYELTGQYFMTRSDLRPGENPCSLPSITAAVQKAVLLNLEPCKILSLGTGGYPFLDRELIQKSFSIVGVEFGFSLTLLAQKMARGLKFDLPLVNADGQRLPFREHSFDACICSETMEHIPDDNRVIEEIYRILKPNGVLILTVPNLWAGVGGPERVRHFLSKRSWVTHANHLREYTYFSAKALVEKHFAIEKWFSVPFVETEFKKMPYHAAMGHLVSLPLFRFLSLSIGFVLKKK